MFIVVYNCINVCTYGTAYPCRHDILTNNNRNNLRWYNLYDEFLKIVRLTDNYIVGNAAVSKLSLFLKLS